jgi:DNA-binding transcriptional ArsR family regulator
MPYVRRLSTIRTEAASLDYDAAETLVVSEPEKMRALADDLRAKIVSLLRERAWSTQELARELGVPKGTVGHHLKVLERAGLIRVVRTRQVRALTEKYYGRVAKLFLFEAEDPADVRAVGAATLRQAAHEIERAPEGASWGLVRAQVSPADAVRFERRLDRLIDDFRKCDAAGGTAFRLAVAFWRAERRDA